MSSEKAGRPTAAERSGPGIGPATAGRQRKSWRSPYQVPAVIAAGGALGAMARFQAGRIWPTATGVFPWTTLTVNVIGCLVIGVFMVAVTEIWSVHRLLRPFFGTGVLGGFTTFSTYGVDIERLVNGGHAGVALSYLAATAVTALVAVSAGVWCARRILQKWSER